MIKVAKFRNFKALKCVDIAFGPLTVFVGPNGSGKTSILEAIHFLSQIGHKPLGAIFSGRRSARLLATGRQLTQTELSVELTTGSQLGVEISQLAPSADINFTLNSIKDGSVSQQSIPYAQAHEISPVVRNLHILDSAVLLRLSADEIARPSIRHGVRPRVEFTGRGTSAVLASLKLADDEGYEKIVENLRRIVPSVLGIRVIEVPVHDTIKQEVSIGGTTKFIDIDREVPGYEVQFDTKSGSRLPAHLMSEGTLYCLALLTALHSEARPDLVLLDDLGSAIHPKALSAVIEMIRGIQNSDPKFQVLATSHSPYLLDSLQMEEVRITTLDDAGYQLCARLSDHPDFEKWKEVMSPGEFWSMVGEGWLKPGSGCQQ